MILDVRDGVESRHSDRYDPRVRSCSIFVADRDLDPDDISSRIGSPPDRSHKRGDLLLGKSVPTHQGLWEVDSAAHLASDELGKHVAFIAGFVEKHRSSLIGLREAGLSVRARIFWDLGDEVLSAVLDPHDLFLISRVIEGFDVSVC